MVFFQLLQNYMLRNKHYLLNDSMSDPYININVFDKVGYNFNKIFMCLIEA